MSRLDQTSFESCTKCTICTEYCPVSRVNVNYPGPKQAGPDGERLRLKDPGLYDYALKYCTNCKRCEVVCPSDVKIGSIVQLAREKYETRRPLLRDIMLSHTDFIGALSSRFAPLVNFFLRLSPVKLILDKGLNISKHRTFPRYSCTTFRRWYEKTAASRQKHFSEQVAFFHGCYINYNNPSLGRDVLRSLNAFNIGVQLLRQEKCCGVALIANRFLKKARKSAKFNITVLEEKITREHIPVLIASSTCALTMREEYPHILGLETAHLTHSLNLVTRYLHLLFEAGRTPRLKHLPLRVAYHTPCHMERLGWTAYSIDLLKRIPGVEVTILESQCCGIAGTYGFKGENYETSQEIGAGLFRQIKALNPDLVVSDCETCKWQIEMNTGARCEHPVTVFAMALE